MEEIMISEKIVEKLKDLMRKNTAIIGWDNKIRNGKIRIFVLQERLSEMTITSLKAEGREIPLEIFPVGRIKALGG
jgi:hypothetical protein